MPSPALPVPTPPTINDAQEETDDMDWEEKLERVGRRKKEWENARISRNIPIDVLEEAMIFLETKDMREHMDEIVQEGWKRLETRRVLTFIYGSEADIKVRVKAEVVKQLEEEKILLTAMKKKLEERQRRQERITLLKDILKKKMTASKLRDTIRMMHLMTPKDLEMEVDIRAYHHFDFA